MSDFVMIPATALNMVNNLIHHARLDVTLRNGMGHVTQTNITYGVSYEMNVCDDTRFDK